MMEATTTNARRRLCQPCKRRGDRVTATGRRAHGPDRERLYVCEACHADDAAERATDASDDAAERRGWARVTATDVRATNRYAATLARREPRRFALGVTVDDIASDALARFAATLAAHDADAERFAFGSRTVDRASARRFAVRDALRDATERAARAAERLASIDAMDDDALATVELAMLRRATAPAYDGRDRASVYADARRERGDGLDAATLATLAASDRERLAAYDAYAAAYEPPPAGRPEPLRLAAARYVLAVPATVVGRVAASALATLASDDDAATVVAWPTRPEPRATDVRRYDDGSVVPMGPTWSGAHGAVRESVTVPPSRRFARDGSLARRWSVSDPHDAVAAATARAARDERERATRPERERAYAAAPVVAYWSARAGAERYSREGVTVHASAVREGSVRTTVGPAYANARRVVATLALA